ncbi:MAG: zinc-binding dehydrogenase [Acidobacteriota bacterium]
MARSPLDDNLPKPKGFKTPTRQEILGRLQALLESGKLTPLIGRTFSLAEFPAAMRSMIEDAAVGRIVITP